MNTGAKLLCAALSSRPFASPRVADRWHLLHDLAEAVELAIASHKSRLREAPAQPQDPPAGPAEEGERTRQTRTHQPGGMVCSIRT